MLKRDYNLNIQIGIKLKDIVGLGLHCLICFEGQISNNSNYLKKFEYFVKFILMKIRINLSNMEVYVQTIQNL